jgi:hypothetical protein
MVESAPASGVLDGEANLLQRHAAVVVAAEDVDASFLKRAEETPFPGGLIVSTIAIVCAIPHCSVIEQRVRTNENRHIIGSDR